MCIHGGRAPRREEPGVLVKMEEQGRHHTLGGEREWNLERWIRDGELGRSWRACVVCCLDEGGAPTGKKNRERRWSAVVGREAR
jgi:hypothetical protein